MRSSWFLTFLFFALASSKLVSEHERLIAAIDRGQFSALKNETIQITTTNTSVTPRKRRFTSRQVPNSQTNQYRTISSNRASPRARLEHAVAPVPTGAVLFGGRRNDDSNDVQSYNDTWIFLSEGELWQRQDFRAAIPASRFGHSLIDTNVDSEGSQPTLFLFGGKDKNTYMDDMWKLSVTNYSDETPTNWTNIQKGTTRTWPSARAQHAVARVPNANLDRDVMFVYGGDEGTDQVSNELWQWDGSVWTFVNQNIQGGPPGGLAEHSMVAVGDSVSNAHLLIYGGRNSSESADTTVLTADTWIYKIADNTWQLLTPSGSPPGARVSHSCVVFDTETSGVYEMHMLFGERQGQRYPDTVSYKLVYSLSDSTGTWYKMNQTDYELAPFPVLRGGQTVTRIPPSQSSRGNIGPDRALIFGGECRLAVNLGLPFRDAWSYTPSYDNNEEGDAGPYINLEVQDYPPTLMSHSATMVNNADISGNQMCIFGGLNVHSGFSQDLWCLTMSSNGTGHGWRHKYTNQKQSQLPIKRADHTTVVLNVDGHKHLVMFGGRNHFAVAIDEKPLGDTWCYSFDAYEWHPVPNYDVIQNVELNRMAHTAVVVTLELQHGNAITSGNQLQAATSLSNTKPPKNYATRVSSDGFIIFGGVIYDADGVDEMTSSVYRCKYSCTNDAIKTDCVCNWANVGATSTPPLPRAWHSAVLLQDKMVVWGGRLTLNEHLNLTDDLVWIEFNNGLTTYSATVKNITGLKPHARYAHGAAQLSNTRMVIVGGFSNRGVESDVWIYDITTNGWNELKSPFDGNIDSFPISKMPRGYQSISFNPTDGQLYLYGGTSLDLSDTENDQEGIVFGFRAGCNSGTISSSFATKACSKCDRDKWAAAGDSQCTTCPAGTQGTDDGATFMTSIFNCTDCIPSYCKGGRCSVSVDSQPFAKCTCHPGFEGPTCESLDAGAKVAIGVGVVFALGMMIALYMRSKKFRAVAQWLKNDNTAKGMQIAQLIKNWQIDPSQIEYTHVIGDGAFGSVHKGMFNSMHVAVKKMKTQGLPPSYYQELCETFHTEASLLIRLRHPNIIHFFGAGYEDDTDKGVGVPILVTELAARGSLQSVLLKEENSISHEQKINFAIDAAEGMEYLHSEQVVHRDLKSPNLLVAESWTVKVADFGTGTLESKFTKNLKKNKSSSAVQSTSTSTAFFENDFDVLSKDDAEKALLMPPNSVARGKSYSNSSVGIGYSNTDHDDDPPSGTTEWMAPELHQAMDNRRLGANNNESKPVFGSEVDVYAFGIVLWEIWAREEPYNDIDPGPGGVTIRKMVLAGERPEIPNSPPAYSLLMTNCWSQSKTSRPTFSVVVKSLKDQKSVNHSAASPHLYEDDQTQTTA